MKQSKTATRALSIVLALVALALAAAFAFGSAQVATASDESEEKTRWEAFVAAVQGGGEVTLGGDLIAFGEGPIAIDKDVTIKGTGIIYRQDGNADWPLFKVLQGKTLTLDGDVTLSGQRKGCGDGTKTLDDFKAGSVDRNLDYFSTPDKGAPTGYRLKNGTTYLSFSTNDFGSWFSTTNPEQAAVFTISKEDAAYTHVMSGGKRVSEFGLTESYDQTQYPPYYAIEPGSAVRPSFEDGKEYILQLSGKGFAALPVTQAGMTMVEQQNDATKFTAEGVGGEEIPAWTIDGTKYTDKTAAETARKTHNDNNVKWTIGDQTFYQDVEGDEAKAQAAVDAYNASHQGCDDTAKCNKWTTAELSNLMDGTDHGFFIQVDGGTVELKGNAKLTNFIAGPGVQNVAPVYVNGGAFNMGDNSQITQNSVGYTAENSYSKGKRANEIRGLLNDGTWARTNTAGAVIYANGAQGLIDGNASITNNRADAGAVVVTGGSGLADEAIAEQVSTLTMNSGAIDNNAGVHFAGATHIYNGGEVVMGGGQMNNNWSWFQGGAVWVSSEVYGSAVFNVEGSARPVADAKFTLDGGTLNGNTTTYQGGALMVESNHVSLLSGELAHNNSRTLGGAVYVAGDAADHMYRLYVKHGCITDNYAVVEGDADSVDKNARIDQGLPDNDKHNPNCSFNNNRENGSANTADWAVNGYRYYQGRGGGIWLCAIGGNATFDYDAEHNVVINDNFADTHGQDINLRPPWPNGGSTINVLSDETGDVVNWKNEVTGAAIQPNTIYTGSLRIENTGQASCPTGGVSIHDNYARNGGGIAANGTVVFGKSNNVYRLMTKFDLTKVWGDGASEEPITLNLKFQAKNTEGEYVNLLEEYTVTLDSEVDTPGENTLAYESAPWVATMALPISGTDENGNPVALFTVKIDGEPQDPTTRDGLVAIFEGVKSGTASLEVGDWRIEVEETTSGGSFIMTPGDVTIDMEDEDTFWDDQETIKYYDKSGVEVAETTVNFVGLAFDQEIINSVETPEIQKYVNQDVHAALPSVDEPFTYDIIAYATKDATKLTITDTLIENLEYVSTSADVKVVDLGTENNYKTNGAWTGKNADATVAQAGTTIDRAVANIEGQNLTVVIPDVDSGEPNLQGHYIKVTVQAKIVDNNKDDYVAVAGTENGAVASDKEHDGLVNTAKYTIDTDREAAYECDSNPVTVKPITVKISKTDLGGTELEGATIKVTGPEGFSEEWTSTTEPHELQLKPGEYTMVEVVEPDGYERVTTTITFTVDENGEVKLTNAEEVTGGKVELLDVDHIVLRDAPIKDTPEIEKYVNQDVHQALHSADEVFTYDIIAYATKDATKLTITDELVKNLEYVSKEADVKAVDLGEKNNHKTNSEFSGTNKDATVAQAGKAIDAKATIDGKRLTVVVDNVEKQGLRGHYIKVTVQAKVADDADYVTISDNGTVASDKEHEGIPNTAKYIVDTARGPYDECESNTVTVKPEKPEIEKYVNKDVHKDVALDEEFEYDIIAYATADATKLTITDVLVKNLEYVSTTDQVSVVDLGTTNNHKTNSEFTGTNADATVSAEGKTIDGVSVSIQEEPLTKNKTLTVVVNDVDKKGLQGHYIKVTFKAKIAEDAGYANVTDNGTVLSDLAHEGLPNKARYVVDTARGAYDKCESNTVTVKPKPEEEKPQIEKYVNKDVHKDIAIDEVFPYDVLVYVPKDADTIQIRDTLVAQLAFVDDADTIAATAVVKDTNNHNVRGTVSSTDGKAIAATGTIDGQTLLVDIADATAARGKYIQITFNARIADGYTVESVAAHFATIEDDGDVKGGITPHTGVPNTAEYRIGIKNGADVDYSKYAPEGGSPEGWNESNTVTVKPVDEPDNSREVTISKQEVGGGPELPGATIQIIDAEGKIVEEWISTTEPHKITLPEGTYTLRETTAPNGYEVAEDMQFRIVEGKTELLQNGEWIDVADHVVMFDAPTPTPTPGTFEVIITKADITTSNELPGAEIKVTGPDGFEAKWTSTNEPHKLNLKPGTYTMEEVNAPAGYDAIKTTITFVVDDEGNVTLTGAYEDLNGKIEVKDLNHLVLSDLPNRYIGSETTEAGAAAVHKIWFDDNTGVDPAQAAVTFQAQYSIDGGATWVNLPGKTLTVTGESMGTDGVWMATFDKLPMTIDGKAAQWRAVELDAPTGYANATSTVAGANGMTAKNLVDDGSNTPKGGVTISKQAVGGGPELPGATLILIDANGNEIERWVSGDRPRNFTLPAGTYTLREITAPNGYEVAEDMTFRVNEDGTVECMQNGQWVDANDHVVMFDKPTPKIDDGGDDNKVNPGTKDNPTTPKTSTPKSTVRGTTAAKTGDMFGMVALAAGAVALLGAGALFLARRRMSK